MEAVERDRVVEQVREATDIVELIGAYVDLRPAGRSFKARCPFHQEKSPSFTVSPEKQVFHCFGCGAGGDVFSFVMKHDGLAFPEALRLLARRAGIELPETREASGPDKTAMISSLRDAVRFYRGRLRAPEGKAAVEYLRARGLPGRILDAYYAGYAPASGRALLEHLQGSFSREVLIEAGLVGQRDDGRLYDRFRDRVMIPILGVGGEPLGFGARALKPDVEPKYLNSPETRLYHKRSELFGLPQARQAIRREGAVLVVEGYFDVLSLAAAGLYHAVAPCGTAWTEGHTRRLLQLRYGQRIVFLFDGDAAGQAAAWRSLTATLPHHTEVALALLPPGMDPDDLVRAGEVDRLRSCLEATLTPVAYGIEVLGREGLSGPALLERIAEMVASVGHDIAREMMIDEAAERSRLPVKVLRREIERLRRRQQALPQRRERGEGAPGEVAREAAPLRLSLLEEGLLRLALAMPEAGPELREATAGSTAIGRAVAQVLSWVIARQSQGQTLAPAELLRRLESELGGEVSSRFLIDPEAPVPDERFKRDLLNRLRQQALELELEGLGRAIRALESGKGPGGGEEGDRDGRLLDLLARKQSLASELSRLREPGGAPAGYEGPAE